MQAIHLNLWRLALLASLAVTLAWLALDLSSLAPRGAFFRFNEGNGLPLGRDFFNFWSYGVEAWRADAGRFYDHALYWRHVAETLGAPYWNPLWSYPPTMMLLAAPFGLLPYHAAFILWQALCLAAFILAVRPFLRSVWDWLLVLAAPAAMMQWQSGQQAYFFAALLIIGFREAGARPWLSGLAFGLLTMKPQLGLIVPFLLLIMDQRRAFWWAAGFALAFNGLSVVAFGIEPWQQYLGHGLSAQMSVLLNNDPVAHQFMPSLYITLQLAGLSAAPAMAGQLALALALIAGFYLLVRGGADTETLIVTAAAFCLAATPYLMSYDLAGALPLILWAARRHIATGLDLAVLWVFAATPLLTFWLGGAALPGGVIFMLAGLVWFWKKALPEQPGALGEGGKPSLGHG